MAEHGRPAREALPDRARADTARGPGRIIVAVYAVFAVSAGARSGVQLATRFSEAPLAYLLSALAAVVYLMAAVALARNIWSLALLACGVELVGVLSVGTASLLAPEAFPDATVWSDYGIGYGFLPLLLPVVGLGWLYRAGPDAVTSPVDRTHRVRRP